jgi:hypothetical protein
MSSSVPSTYRRRYVKLEHTRHRCANALDEALANVLCAL